MEKTTHTFTELFMQLGLPHDPPSIEAFLKIHTPLPAATHLAQAPFWTPSQSQFLKEQLAHDADWCEVIDQLNAALR